MQFCSLALELLPLGVVLGLEAAQVAVLEIVEVRDVFSSEGRDPGLPGGFVGGSATRELGVISEKSQSYLCFDAFRIVLFILFMCYICILLICSLLTLCTLF